MVVLLNTSFCGSIFHKCPLNLINGVWFLVTTFFLNKLCGIWKIKPGIYLFFLIYCIFSLFNLITRMTNSWRRIYILTEYFKSKYGKLIFLYKIWVLGSETRGFDKERRFCGSSPQLIQIQCIFEPKGYKKIVFFLVVFIHGFLSITFETHKDIVNSVDYLFSSIVLVFWNWFWKEMLYFKYSF